MRSRVMTLVGVGAMICALALPVSAQSSVPCDKCQPKIEITQQKWNCVKPMVAQPDRAPSNPFRFPIPKEGCDGTMGNPVYRYGEPVEAAPALAGVPKPSWQYLRVSEATCLKSLGPEIDKRLNSNAGATLIVDVKNCTMS